MSSSGRFDKLDLMCRVGTRGPRQVQRVRQKVNHEWSEMLIEGYIKKSIKGERGVLEQEETYLLWFFS